MQQQQASCRWAHMIPPGCHATHWWRKRKNGSVDDTFTTSSQKWWCRVGVKCLLSVSTENPTHKSQNRRNTKRGKTQTPTPSESECYNTHTSSPLYVDEKQSNKHKKGIKTCSKGTSWPKRIEPLKQISCHTCTGARYSLRQMLLETHWESYSGNREMSGVRAERG